MSRYKIAAITAIAAMSLLTGATASANEVIGTIVPAKVSRTSDPCTSELKSTNYNPEFINIAPLGDRGTEGLNAEIVNEILKNIQFIVLNNFK